MKGKERGARSEVPALAAETVRDEPGSHATRFRERFFTYSWLLAPRSFLLAFISLLSIVSNARAQSFSLDDIKFWVGSGKNRAVLVIDWDENASDVPALAWGFRWDGVAHGDDMLAAIIAADSRLFSKLGGTRDSPTAAYGLGYDANGDGRLVLDDGTAFDEQGFAFTSPADLATSVDAADYYAEGWFTGFWHYGVASMNPFDGGAWSDTPVGMAQRPLTDGDWDSWTFSSTFNFAAFAENAVAAPPPYSPGDFNLDGSVDIADYQAWHSEFGVTSETAADANDDGLVDAADYVVWRKALHSAANSSSTASLQIPEPQAAVLSLFCLWSLRPVRYSMRRKMIS